MKLTLKEKAKLFWERNKGMILGLAAMAGAATAIGAVGVHYTKKAEKEHQEELEAQRAKWKEERKAAEAEEEKIKNDPANQIAGGYVRPENDDLTNPEIPNILINTVPVSNMGELGQEVIQRLNEEWFGEFGETDVENSFDPETATADVMIYFGHEVWKRNNPEESESQEKQSV